MINGSFNDFVKWMNCLGYEFEITGNEIVFRDRNYFYDKTLTALTLAEDELADLVTSVDSEKSGLRPGALGYSRQIRRFRRLSEKTVNSNAGKKTGPGMSPVFRWKPYSEKLV